MFGDIIQPTHLLFVLVVALLVLGPKRLPEVGRSLGRGLRDFRQGMSGIEAEARDMFSGHDETPADRVEAVVQSDPAPVQEPAPKTVEPTPAPVASAVATEPDPGDYVD